MQDTSEITNYDAIIASEGHWFETRLIIDGVGTFGETDLFSVSTKLEMFSDTPTVGMAVAGEIDVKMIKPSTDIPQMAVLRPQIRVCNDTLESGWLPQGVFFIDTREQSKNGNGLDVITLHGYDAMLKAEQTFMSSAITGSSVDTDMVDAIAAMMGVSVDTRTYTMMTRAYTIPLPTGYSCREVLGYIASMYVGCFIMTDTGKLRLVTLTELPPETNLLYATIGGEDYYLVFGTGANATRILV